MNKTHMAMFALSAFALIGMMGGSAFADTVASTQVTVTSPGNNISYKDTPGCGTGDDCTLKVYAHNSNDEVTLQIEVEGSTTCDRVDYYTFVSPGWSSQGQIYNANGFYSVNSNGQVDTGDKVTGVAVFNGCS